MLKKRNWAFVVYPESMPNDFIEYLQKGGVACAISPLHDKDVNPTGEEKKAHYHIILSYEGPTTKKNVEEYIKYLNGTIPIPLEQLRGYYRYLTHKDNPEKFQYDENDIICLNGFDISKIEKFTENEIFSIRVQIIQLIKDHNIVEYSTLIDYLRINDLQDFLRVAMQSTILLDRYLSSRRNKVRDLKETQRKLSLEKDN